MDVVLTKSCCVDQIKPVYLKLIRNLLIKVSSWVFNKIPLFKETEIWVFLKSNKYTNNQPIKFHAYKNKLTNAANSNYKFKCSASWVLTKIKPEHLTLIKINFHSNQKSSTHRFPEIFSM